MKKILVLIGSAVLGSVFTLFFLHVFASQIINVSDTSLDAQNSEFIHRTSYSGSASGAIGVDFTEASA